MKRISAFINHFAEDSGTYFAAFRDNIAQKNMLMLHRLNLCALVLLAGYFFAALFLFNNLVLQLLYIVFFLFHCGLLVFTVRYRRRALLSYRMVQGACILFMASILGFILLISVFPFPDRPSIFFSLFYLLTAVLFILPYWQINLLLSSFEVLFVLLVLCCKADTSVGYDLFGSITAWILGWLISFLVLDLHIREGKALAGLEAVSSTDATTGLPNRRAFDIHMQGRFASCGAEGAPLAVILLDIDDFKKFNDTYGHVAGDDCLARIGAALKTYAGEQAIFVARFGGEELIAVAAGEQAARAPMYAQDLRRLVGRCAIPVKDGEVARVTASVGVAVDAPNLSGSPLDLIHRADAALYWAKAQGKDRVVVYEPEMNLFE